MNDNIIMAVFNHNTEITTKSSTQWNRGQILRIEGIYNLPSAFEVEVSNDRERGAKRYLGHDYEFVIPDEYFESGKMIYIWIMKRVQPTDITSKYLVKIPMKTRQKPMDYDTDPEKRDIVAEAIVALQDAEHEITTKMDEVIDREEKIERIEESFYNLTALAETLPAGSEATVDKEKVDTDEENYMIFRFGIPQGEKGERGDTGSKGDKGDTGNGIDNIVLNPDYTLTVNYTDGSSYRTGVIRGVQGERGIQGEKGEKGDKGDAFIYSDFTQEQLASLKGDKGDDGNDGHSPTITASKSGSVTSISVDNTVVATINDGSKGDKGDKGDDGRTPTITASKLNGVTSVSVDGTVVATINDGSNGNDGQDGQDGNTPVITASKTGTETTIYADGNAIATINDGINGQNGADGQNGVDGQDGADGHSPVVTASKSNGVTSVSVDGSVIATINDGVKGDTGNSGVYIGTDAPTDSNVNVWIDSDGIPDRSNAIVFAPCTVESGVEDNFNYLRITINKTYNQIIGALDNGSLTFIRYTNPYDGVAYVECLLGYLAGNNRYYVGFNIGKFSAATPNEPMVYYDQWG